MIRFTIPVSFSTIYCACNSKKGLLKVFKKIIMIFTLPYINIYFIFV